MIKAHQIILALLLVGPISYAAPGEQYRHLGVLLPAGSKQIAPNRFQSPRSYTDTVKEMRQRLLLTKSMSQIGDEINLPHVRDISFQNTDANSLFRAINIYANLQTGITEIFFVLKSNKPTNP